MTLSYYEPLASKDRMDDVMTKTAKQICHSSSMNFLDLSLRVKIAITHYRCDRCKSQPLYHLDLECLNRPKCGLCGLRVKIGGRSKYSKIRKELAISISRWKRDEVL